MPLSWKKSTKTVANIALFPFMFIFGNILMLLILLRDFIPHKKLNAGTLMAKKDFETTVLTYWQAPATFGFKCIIPKGFLFKVKEKPSYFSYYFECFPENVEEFEQKLLPEDIRTDPKFGGYRIFLKFRDLGKKFEGSF